MEAESSTVTLTEGAGAWSAKLSDRSTVPSSLKPSETFAVSPTANPTYKTRHLWYKYCTAASAAAPAITASALFDGSCVL